MPATTKIDLYKLHKADYVSPKKKPVLVDVTAGSYLSYTGKGAPEDEAFQHAFEALFGIAYTVKFRCKADGRDYAVCKVEAIWWGKGKGGNFADEKRCDWNWQLLIRTPDFVTPEMVDQAAKALIDKGKGNGVKKVKLVTLDEGRCVQMLHVGPYSDEPRTMAVMREFAESEGLSLTGRHHEVYLSDPRRVVPERLRTILRQPVRA